jgi:hypothetical protein
MAQETAPRRVTLVGWNHRHCGATLDDHRWVAIVAAQEPAPEAEAGYHLLDVESAGRLVVLRAQQSV